MAEPFIGEIRLFAASWAPRGWHLCDGTLLEVSSYQTLFALLGNAYGGNGITDFALPDFRGRMIVQPSKLNGRGSSLGLEKVTLSLDEIPPHTHRGTCYTGDPETESPAAAILANASQPIYSQQNSPVALAPQTINDSGGGQPHDNMQPSLVLNYIIALNGIFPSRT